MSQELQITISMFLLLVASLKNSYTVRAATPSVLGKMNVQSMLTVDVKHSCSVVMSDHQFICCSLTDYHHDQ